MKNGQIGRRNFIKLSALGGLAAISSTSFITEVLAADKIKKFNLNVNDIILFQGDSITDAGRDRNLRLPNDPRALGNGYVLHTAAELLNGNPKKNLKVLNRGISGDKVFQLASRWDDDTISLHPTILSILVGVNDYWHIAKHNYAGTIKTYRDDYQTLLNKTMDKLPGTRLIIGEPYALQGGVVARSWFPAFHEYRYIARELADKYNATFMPYQSIFDEALKLAPWSYWTIDGVHPSLAGTALMSAAFQSLIKR